MYDISFLICFITKLKYFPFICLNFTDDEDESEEEQTIDNEAEVDCPCKLNSMYF